MKMINVNAVNGHEILTMTLAFKFAFVSAISKISPPTLSKYLDTKAFYPSQSRTDKEYERTDTSIGPSFSNISLVDVVL